MSKEDFERIVNEENNRIKDIYGLEAILKQSLWDAQVGDKNFNGIFSYLVGMMKQCVENDDYKKQLYKIKNQRRGDEPEKPTELETTLTQKLLDANVDDDEFEETFADIINFTKRCVENPDYKKQLYKINLNEYKPEE